jgi:hypothetical protein
MNNSLTASIKPQFRTVDGLRNRSFCSIATHVPSSTSPRSRSTATPRAPHAEPTAYALKFAGLYSHRTIERGIGHNLPQQPPDDFASAILEVSAMR